MRKMFDDEFSLSEFKKAIKKADNTPILMVIAFASVAIATALIALIAMKITDKRDEYLGSFDDCECCYAEDEDFE